MLCVNKNTDEPVGRLQGAVAHSHQATVVISEAQDFDWTGYEPPAMTMLNLPVKTLQVNAVIPERELMDRFGGGFKLEDLGASGARQLARMFIRTKMTSFMLEETDTVVRLDRDPINLSMRLRIELRVIVLDAELGEQVFDMDAFKPL